jgi:hypothetical protein
MTGAGLSASTRKVFSADEPVNPCASVAVALYVWLLPGAYGPPDFTQLADVLLAAQLPIEEPSTNISTELSPALSVAVAAISTAWLDVGLGGEWETEVTAGGIVSPAPPSSDNFSVMVRS